MSMGWAASLYCVSVRDGLEREDCAVPFTLRNIKEDLEDIGFRFDGAPDLEFRAATKALNSRHPPSATSASRPAIAFRTATHT